VLDVQDGRMLVLSEYIIERRIFHDSQTDLSWEVSKLRQYLNGDFYDSFTPDEQAKIVEVQLANKANQWFSIGKDDHKDTTDKVFLLSLEEVVMYLGDSGLLEPPPGVNPYLWMGWGIDDIFNEDRIAYELDGTAGWWWLRSPGGDTSDNYPDHPPITGITSVWADGRINLFSQDILREDPDVSIGGVRPALWLIP
jgi:hypothetical protein